MNTLIHRIDQDNINKDTLLQYADIVKRGGLVAFPTETVYGLGANCLDERAVEKIFAVKNRPANNPLFPASFDETAPEVKAETAIITSEAGVTKFSGSSKPHISAEVPVRSITHTIIPTPIPISMLFAKDGDFPEFFLFFKIIIPLPKMCT